MPRSCSARWTALLSPRKLCRWWSIVVSSPFATDKTGTVDPSKQLGKGEGKLPDAVADTWLRWGKEQEGVRCDGNTCNSLKLSESTSSVLRRFPAPHIRKADRPDANESACDTVKDGIRGEAVEEYSMSVDALCATNSPRRSSSPQAVLARLRCFMPLFLRVDASAEQRAVLARRCRETEGANAGDFPAAADPYLLRVLRQVRVSWQPWVKAAQKSRLIARDTPGALTAFTEETPTHQGDARLLELLRRSTSTTAAQGDPSALNQVAFWRSEALVREAEQERSWRILLETVPEFYVSVDLVHTELLQRYPSEGARLWASWTRTTTTMAKGFGGEARADAPHATKNGGEEIRSSLKCDDAPLLEMTEDGCAVRTPSIELCLQRGCPARLLYGGQRHASVSLRDRYSLSQNTNYGPELMHLATSLLAATVPTTPTSLPDLRELFSEQIKDVWQQVSSTSSAPFKGKNKDSATHFERGVSFFSCVEVLLDHPDLAFALRIRDTARGVVRAGLPSPPREHDTHASRDSDNLLLVQLHPAFAHERRGGADVALRALLRVRAVHHLTGACTSLWHLRRTSCATACEANAGCVAFHVHYLRSLSDSVASSLLTQLCSACGERRSVASIEERAVCAVSCVGLGEVARQQMDAVEQEGLVFVVTEGLNRADAIVVMEPCRSILLTRLFGVAGELERAQEVAPIETEAGDVPRVLGALVRMLCGSAVVRVAPSRLFYMALPHRSGLTRLFGALPDAALASFCTLQHVACFAGYPMGEQLTTGEGADLLLAAAVCARHGVHFALAPEEGKQEGRKDADAERCLADVADAGSLAVAASFLLRDRRMEKDNVSDNYPSRFPFFSSRLQAAAAHNSSFADSLKAWAGSQGAMYDYNVALRLERYTDWLDRLIGTGNSLPLERPEVISETDMSDTSLSPAAARAALLRLVALYGPEPFPAAAVPAGTLVRTTRGSNESTELAGVHAVAATPFETSINTTTAASLSGTSSDEGTADNSDNAPSLSAAPEKHLSFDASLYDALLQDAAAVQLNVASTQTAKDHATLHTAPPQTPPTGKDEREAESHVAAVPPQPGAAEASVDVSQEEDTLQFYLSTIFGEDGGNGGCDDGLTSLTAAASPFAGPTADPRSTSRPSPVVDVVTASDRHPSPPSLPRGFVFGPRSRRMPRESAGEGHAGAMPGQPSRQRQCDNNRRAFGTSVVAAVPPYSPTHFPPFPSFHSSLASTLTSVPPSAALGAMSTVARFNPFAPQAAATRDSSRCSNVRESFTGSPLSFPPRTDRFSPPSPPSLPPAPPRPPPMPPTSGCVTERGENGVGTGAGADGGAANKKRPCLSNGTSDFLGIVSDAERLRLASMIVDILRGSSGSPPTPPRC